jgi:hypothetical protein
MEKTMITNLTCNLFQSAIWDLLPGSLFISGNRVFIRGDNLREEDDDTGDKSKARHVGEIKAEKFLAFHVPSEWKEILLPSQEMVTGIVISVS